MIAVVNTVISYNKIEVVRANSMIVMLMLCSYSLCSTGD